MGPSLNGSARVMIMDSCLFRGYSCIFDTARIAAEKGIG